MGGLLHLVQRGGAWRAGASPSPLLAVPSVTAHPSTANIPTSYRSIWHYNCLCTLYRINRFTSMTSLRRNLEVLNTATLTTSTASRHSEPHAARDCTDWASPAMEHWGTCSPWSLRVLVNFAISIYISPLRSSQCAAVDWYRAAR